MTMLRELLAIVIFLLGIFFIFKLCVEPFQLIFLMGAIICLLFAYFIWPSKKNGARHEDNIFLDGVEVAIDLPFDILLWVFRFLIRVFRKSDMPDIDL